MSTNPLRRRVHSFYELDVHAGYTLSSTWGKTRLFAGILNVPVEAAVKAAAR